MNSLSRQHHHDFTKSKSILLDIFQIAKVHIVHCPVHCPLSTASVLVQICLLAIFWKHLSFSDVCGVFIVRTSLTIHKLSTENSKKHYKICCLCFSVQGLELSMMNVWCVKEPHKLLTKLKKRVPLGPLEVPLKPPKLGPYPAPSPVMPS